MIRSYVTAGAFLALAQPLWATAPGGVVPVPSGQTVTLIEALSESMADGLWLRLRFLAPAIGGALLDFDVASGDMLDLCRNVGVPMLQNDYPQAVGIIISLSDRPLDFGVSDPDATQFFEAYRAESGDCIWEEF